MMLKTKASVAVLTLMLSTAALAQSTPGQLPSSSTPAKTEAPKMPVAGQILAQDANTFLAKEFIGQTIYAPDKSKIGSISDLILTKDGKTVEGFVVGIGGFLGLGEKNVAMKLDRLQITPANGGLQLVSDVKTEELRNAPAFKTKKEQDAEKQAAERARDQPARPAPKPGTN
jgi:sporulation protein YlmC with PRC-barrel domain